MIKNIGLGLCIISLVDTYILYAVPKGKGSIKKTDRQVLEEKLEEKQELLSRLAEYEIVQDRVQFLEKRTREFEGLSVKQANIAREMFSLLKSIDKSDELQKRMYDFIAKIQDLTVLNYPDTGGVTCLMLAFFNDYVDIINLLLQKGVNVNFQDKNGDNALMFTVIKNKIAMTKLLLDNHALIDLRNKSGMTVLMYAAANGYMEIVSMLLDKKAVLDVNMQNQDGFTALMLACQYGKEHVVKKLLGDGAKIDIRSQKGATALVVAANCGFSNIVIELLKHGANINEQTNARATALMCAVSRGHVDVVNILLNAGADPFLKTNDGDTALKMALDLGLEKIVSLLKIAMDERSNRNTLLQEAKLNWKNIVKDSKQEKNKIETLKDENDFRARMLDEEQKILEELRALEESEYEKLDPVYKMKKEFIPIKDWAAEDPS